MRVGHRCKHRGGRRWALGVHAACKGPQAAPWVGGCAVTTGSFEGCHAIRLGTSLAFGLAPRVRDKSARGLQEARPGGMGRAALLRGVTQALLLEEEKNGGSVLCGSRMAASDGRGAMQGGAQQGCRPGTGNRARSALVGHRARQGAQVLHTVLMS